MLRAKKILHILALPKKPRTKRKIELVSFARGYLRLSDARLILETSHLEGW